MADNNLTDFTNDNTITEQLNFKINVEYLEKAKRDIESLSNSFNKIENALKSVGIANSKVLNSFKEFSINVGILNSLKEQYSKTNDENIKYRISTEASKIALQGFNSILQKTIDLFNFNIKTLNASNANWESFRLASIMTSLELNKVAASYEQIGAAALMSYADSAETVFRFKEEGLVLNEQNENLIKTTGKIATVFNVDLATAVRTIAKQYQYLGLTQKDIHYGMGLLTQSIKNLGLVGSEALEIFNLLGSNISLVFTKGKREGFEFANSLLELKGILKSFGLDINSVATQIKGTLEADDNAIRTHVLMANQLGMSYDELMEEMMTKPTLYAYHQQKAFEQLVGTFDNFTNPAKRQQIIEFGKFFGLSLEQINLTVTKYKEGKSLADELYTKAIDAEKKRKELEKSGKNDLDKAFQTQMSDFQKGLSGLKKGLSALWDSSLRPVLGYIIGKLGNLMGKLGSFFEQLSKNNIAKDFMIIAGTLTTIAGPFFIFTKSFSIIRDLFSVFKNFPSVSKIFNFLNITTFKEGNLGVILTDIFGEGSKTLSLMQKFSYAFKIFPKVIGKIFGFFEIVLMAFDFFSTKGDLATKLSAAITGSKIGGIKGMFSGGIRWATIGAVIGSLIGSPLVGGIIGAALGALLGGTLGYIGGENISKFFRNRSAALLLGSVFALLLPGFGAPLGYWLGSLIDNKTGGETYKNISSFFKGFFSPFSNVFNQISDTFKSVYIAFKSIFSILIKEFKIFIDTLSPIFSSFLKVLVNTLQPLFTIFINLLKPFLDLFSPLFENLSKLLNFFNSKMGPSFFEKLGEGLAKLLITLNPLISALELFAKAFKKIEPLLNSFGIKTKETTEKGKSLSTPIGGLGNIFTNITGGGISEKEKQALDFFEARGWDKHQAIGIVANLKAESGLNPFAEGDKNLPGGSSWGIAQWRGKRKLDFQKLFGKPIEKSTFEEQLAFIDWELNNTELLAGNILKKAKTPEEAASLFDEMYERSSGISRGKRIKIASELSSIYAQEGALITKPTFTLMGESGPELVAPLDKIDNILTMIITKALTSVNKTVTPTTSPLVSIMQSLLEIEKAQLYVQKNILKAIEKVNTKVVSKPDGLVDTVLKTWISPPI